MSKVRGKRVEEPTIELDEDELMDALTQMKEEGPSDQLTFEFMTTLPKHYSPELQEFLEGGDASVMARALASGMAHFLLSYMQSKAAGQDEVDGVDLLHLMPKGDA